MTKIPEKADPPGSLGRVAVAAPLEILGVQVEPVDPPPRHGSRCAWPRSSDDVWGEKTRCWLNCRRVGEGKPELWLSNYATKKGRGRRKGKDVLIGGE